jgi:dolichyldiphosphatase
MGWGESGDHASLADGGATQRSSYDDEWIAFSQTLVVHPTGLVGNLMGLLSLMPFAIGVGFVTLIIFRRDLHTIFFLLGVFVNSFVNVVLKKIIAQERPPFPSQMKKYHGNEQSKGYGMPSHHSQFIWFFCFYMVLFLMFRVKSPLPRSTGDHFFRQLWMYFLLALASAVSYSRYYLGYHTLEQVVVGAVVGIVMACAWFYYIQHHASPCFLKILCHPWAQFFMLRDTTMIPNIMMFEYCNIMDAVKHRARARPDISKCLNQGSLFCSSSAATGTGGRPSCKKHENCF